MPIPPTPKVHRLHISKRDFEGAKKFIEKARGYAENTVEYEALVEAAIIRYVRPFSGNEKGENPKADSRLTIDVSAVLGDEADVELHERIKQLRNKVIAHAESEFYPMSLIDSFIGGESDRRK